MKLLASILPFYVLLLIAMPCVDVTDNDSLLKIDLSGHRTGNNNNDVNHCSPFCTCDCCVIPVIQQDSTIHLDCFEYTYREYAEYSVSYTSSVYACIWQPPKLVSTAS
jgi:hypothetical protein